MCVILYASRSPEPRSIDDDLRAGIALILHSVPNARSLLPDAPPPVHPSSTPTRRRLPPGPRHPLPPSPERVLLMERTRGVAVRVINDRRVMSSRHVGFRFVPHSHTRAQTHPYKNLFTHTVVRALIRAYTRTHSQIHAHTHTHTRAKTLSTYIHAYPHAGSGFRTKTTNGMEVSLAPPPSLPSV